jgi:hypothetical protein
LRCWWAATALPTPPRAKHANTMFLFLPDGEWQYHDKVQLVPLGEYVPYREWLPFLRVFGVVEGDLRAGETLHPLQAGDMRLGAVICMESTYPWVARGLVNAGANLAGSRLQRVVVWAHGGVGAALGVLHIAGDRDAPLGRAVRPRRDHGIRCAHRRDSRPRARLHRSRAGRACPPAHPTDSVCALGRLGCWGGRCPDYAGNRL